MTYKEDPIFQIEPQLVMRYLMHAGWKAETYSSNIRRMYLEDDTGSDPVEVFFSLQKTGDAKLKEVFFALNTISDLYEKPLEIVSREVSAITYDLIASKIPDEYVVNNSIHLKIASQYVNRMRDFLADSATTELSGERSFRRNRKEAVDYAEKCRFGHTFRGSFGFLIESPVGLNDNPTMDMVEESLPLGRRVTERIAHGLQAYSQAVSEQSPSVIVNRLDGFSANMCDAMADIIEEAEVYKIAIEIKLSPEWRRTEGLERSMNFAVESKDIELLRDAARSMRVQEKPKSVAVFGRVKRLETDGNPADLLEDTSAREIEISWVNEDSKIIYVKVMITPQQYLDAVEAHKTGSAVSASGLLVRAGRSWRLENVENFRVINF